MKKALLLLVFLSLLINLNSQITQQQGTAEIILPKGFAPGEEALMKDYIAGLQSRSLACITSPPEGKVRSMAEWEEQQALVITWTSFTNILTEIVRHAREEVEVIIVCSNENVVKNQLNSAGVNWSSNVTFIEDEFDSIWVRDYGPNSIYLDDVEELAFVDWIYNRPRPDDDRIPEVVADYLGLDNYCTTIAPLDIVHTGGNYMSDGLGTAFSSDLVLEENGPFNEWGTSNHSEEEFLEIMNQFMGIEAYPLMEALPYDVIHHIDMHMKLLNEETLLVGEYPEGVADGPQIEANIQYVLDNYKTAYGEDFKIVRIPMPPDNGAYPDTWWADYRTYANSVIVNTTILVPTYEEQYDTTALRIWEENMPGYNIIGIECNDIIPSLGAIHCITKEVGVSEPLWISMNKVDFGCMEEATLVEAQIKHKTGVSGAMLYYKTDASDWLSLEMSNSSDDIWSAEIPMMDENTKVSYYIEATADNGKQITRPLPGAEGPFDYEVKFCGIVSIDELITGQTKLETIFPNPASAITCIPVTSEFSIEGTIQVMDVLGRLVETVYQGDIPAGESKYFINADTYQAGTYFVTLTTQAGSHTQKLLVK